MKLPPDGPFEVFRQPSNRANGLIFDDQWRLIACEGSDAETDNPRARSALVPRPPNPR